MSNKFQVIVVLVSAVFFNAACGDTKMSQNKDQSEPNTLQKLIAEPMTPLAKPSQYKRIGNAIITQAILNITWDECLEHFAYFYTTETGFCASRLSEDDTTALLGEDTELHFMRDEKGSFVLSIRFGHSLVQISVVATSEARAKEELAFAFNILGSNNTLSLKRQYLTSPASHFYPSTYLGTIEYSNLGEAKQSLRQTQVSVDACMANLTQTPYLSDPDWSCEIDPTPSRSIWVQGAETAQLELENEDGSTDRVLFSSEKNGPVTMTWTRSHGHSRSLAEKQLTRAIGKLEPLFWRQVFGTAQMLTDAGFSPETFLPVGAFVVYHEIELEDCLNNMSIFANFGKCSSPVVQESQADIPTPQEYFDLEAPKPASKAEISTFGKNYWDIHLAKGEPSETWKDLEEVRTAFTKFFGQFLKPITRASYYFSLQEVQNAPAPTTRIRKE